MFSAHTKKKFSPCNMAVFFDFDEVLHTSDELEEKESSSPKPVDITLLKQITQLAIKHNYPLIIVTARADNKKNRDFIEQFITLINGFHTDAGGFHLNDIYCLGVESYQRKSHKKSLISIRQPKLNVIQKVHLEKFPTLSPKQIYFIEDEEKHCLPVEEAGYTVIRAKSGSNKHLENIFEVMQENIQQKYSLPFAKKDYQSDGLFKPREKKEKHVSSSTISHKSRHKEISVKRI